MEVGYLLSHACWGKGFATEAARASLAYGFDTLSLEAIICLVDPDNQRSNRVAAKLEMTFLGKQTYFGMVLNKYMIAGERTVAGSAPSVGQTCPPWARAGDGRR